jgi:citrate lyase subunit beta/citryl-CoA lyase
VAGVLCPAFGSLDLARDLGISPSHPVVMDHARVRLVLAARAAGVAPPLDGVCPDLRDAARIEREARAARNLGLGGKMAIHPAQLLPIREGFRPNSEELAWAQRILEAADGGAGAMQLDGQMIDAPVLSRARAVLARGESTFG